MAMRFSSSTARTRGCVNRSLAYLRNSISRLTILHEKPNKGRTVIEKFSDYSNVGFAVVLLTADDRGGPKDQPYEGQGLRPRQNVLLELGFFLGSQGPGKLVPLCEPPLTLPPA